MPLFDLLLIEKSVSNSGQVIVISTLIRSYFILTGFTTYSPYSFTGYLKLPAVLKFFLW